MRRSLVCPEAISPKSKATADFSTEDEAVLTPF